MKKLFILIAFACLLALPSCRWVSTTDTVSMQRVINADLAGLTTNDVLEELGQPSSVEVDSSSLDGIVITKLHYDDKETLQWYFRYDEKYQPEDPFVDVYLKDGKVFSTKTNIVKTVISRNEKTISIIKIATYSGVLLLIVAICCVSLLLIKRSSIKDIDERLAALVDMENRNDSKIENLQVASRNLTNDVSSVKGRTSKAENCINSLEKVFRSNVDSNNTNFREISARLRILEKMQGLVPENSNQKNNREKQETLFATKISSLGLSVRTYNILHGAGITYLGQLCSYKREEILEFRNAGKKSLSEIDHHLENFGLYYGMDLSDFGYGPHESPFDNQENQKKESSPVKNPADAEGVEEEKTE